MAPRNTNMVAEKEHRKSNHMKKVLLGDESTKTMSFKKRFPTLKKKAQELKTLCNVSVCIVCFDKYGGVHMFPDDESELKGLVQRFKVLGGNAKKEINCMEYLEEQAEKHRKKNLDEMFLKLSKWIEGLPESDALEILDSNINTFKEKIEILAFQEAIQEMYTALM